MSLVRNVATGFGQWGMRLVIEGLSREFVTDASMAGAGTDGRTRVNGLVGDTIEIKESVDIAQATLDVGGQSIRIVDIAGKPTLEFGTRPAATWWLDADVTDSASALTLVDTTGLSNGDVIHVDTECILIGTVASSTSLTGCTRGYRQTYAQAHYTQDGARALRPAITRVPQTLEGRRAWIYFYGQGDTTSGPGTQRWIGRCATAPRMSGDMTAWEFTIDPITAILNQSVGADVKDPCGPRGIYYPWDAPIRIEIAELSAATIDAGPSVEQALQLPTSSSGFFETQESFCAALNSQITLGGSWKAASIKCVPVDDASWRIEITIGAAGNERYVAVSINLAESGVFLFRQHLMTAARVVVNTVVADTTYYVFVEGPVPRGSFGPSPHGIPFRDSSLAATWPNNRVYLGGSAVVGTSTAVRSSWPDEEEMVQRITANDDAARIMELQNIPTVRDHRGVYAFIPYGGRRGLPSFKFARYYGSGSVATFLTALATAAPTYANLGATPDIRAPGTTSDDFDIVGTTALTVAEAATSTFQRTRYYYAATGKKLSEVLAAEAQLLGCFWALDYYGRIVLRKMQPALVGADVAGTIASSTLIVSGGFGEIEHEAFGTVNTVIVRTGYKPDADNYDGVPFTIRDVSSFGLNKAERTVEIKPVSYADLDYEAPEVAGPVIAHLATALFGMFGGPYMVATVEVAMTLFDVRCGDVVTFSHAQMPNTTGTRGLVSKPALVIGRAWQPRKGSGSLTLLMHASEFAGYTPTMRITAASPAGSQTSLVLTVAATTVGGTTRYIPTDMDATDFYQSGDAVFMREWDATSPVTRVGTVTASTATTISVTFTVAYDLAAAIAAGTVFMIGWDNALAAVTRQQSYAYMATSTMMIGFAPDLSAKVFSA